MDAPLNLGGEVRLLEERKQSLAQAIECRPTSKVTAVSPAAAAKLSEIPDRHNFEHGTAAGEEAHAAAMRLFVEKNFEHGDIEQHSVEQHE